MQDMGGTVGAAYGTALSILNAAFARRYHSVAQYILGADPYVRDEDQNLLRRIQAIAAYDIEEAERLVDVIESLNGIPYVPPFDHEVAEWNYLALAYLGDALADTLTKQLFEYEDALPHIEDVPKAYEALQRVCKTLRTHILSLREAA